MAPKPRLLALLLVAALLALSFSPGVVEGRNVRVMRAVRHYGERPLHGRLQQRQWEEEEVSTVMDYADPKANTNTHGGVIPPTDPTSPPAH